MCIDDIDSRLPLSHGIMVSIIIVNYNVKKELFECLESIISSRPKAPYEIVVVDNDEEKTIQNELYKKFSKAIYIPNANKGFGQGNNVGAKRAKGEYLFFLNPDTKVVPLAIDELVSFLKNNTKAGIVAPLLHDLQGEAYQQGAMELTPKSAIISLSFINKLFPNNPISKKYFLADWNKKDIREVDIVPGTAFMIRKNIFEEVGGFDENFFLYFEEFDLCRRVKKLGLKIFINPEAKIMHYWGLSTGTRDDIDSIFKESRFYYFKKHFGIISAFFTESILRINKYSILLILIISLAAFLRLYRIGETMPFISDQGWFYLSARDMLLTGNIPLVGIASSHPWLHQGPLWTYMLAFVFALSGFNPLNGAYLSIVIDILALIAIFKIGSCLFSKRVGLIAAIFYATSPLIIFNARMPYHTSPIPLFTILFIFFLYKWVTGSKYYFPLSIMALAILYNLELATAPFLFVFLIVLFFGLWKKKSWAGELKNKKILLFSFLAFFIPMLAVLIYDAYHNFPQTIGFITWIGYRALVLLGLSPLHPEIQTTTFNSVLTFAADSYQKLIFIDNPITALIIFISSICFFYYRLIKNMLKKNYQTNWILLALITTFSIISIFAIKTPSSAYLPMLFPGLIILTALFFDGLIAVLSNLKYLFWFLIILIAVFNSHFFITTINKDYGSFSEKLKIAKQIITQANGKEYNLIWGEIGRDWQFQTLNYEYLIWQLGGRGISHKPQKLQFIIKEYEKKIKVTLVIARP